MAYTPGTWVENVSVIHAADLARIEAGIAAVPELGTAATTAATDYDPAGSASAVTAATLGAATTVALASMVPVRRIPRLTILSKGSGLTGVPTVATGGAGYVVGDTVTLGGGVFASPAVLTVATVTAGAAATVTVLQNGVYTTTKPVLTQAATSGVGAGATFNTAWSVNGATTALTRQAIAPTDARVRFTGNGPLNESGSGCYGNTVGNATHSSFEWSTDSQHVDISLIGLNTSGVLIVDGKQASDPTIQTDVSGVRYAYSIDFGTAAVRQFKWVAFNNAFGTLYIDSTATLTAPLAAPPLAWALGDSYTGATGAENPYSQHIAVMAAQLGIDVLPDGIGGTGWNSAAGNAPAARVSAKLSVLSRVPQYVFLDLGFNDAGGSMTTAASSIDATIAAVVSAAPNAKIIAFGPATPKGATANLDLVKATLAARCASAAVPFVDVSGWVTQANAAVYTGPDNIHPTALGHKYLGVRRAVAVAALL